MFPQGLKSTVFFTRVEALVITQPLLRSVRTVTPCEDKELGWVVRICFSHFHVRARLRAYVCVWMHACMHA